MAQGYGGKNCTGLQQTCLERGVDPCKGELDGREPLHYEIRHKLTNSSKLSLNEAALSLGKEKALLILFRRVVHDSVRATA